MCLKQTFESAICNERITSFGENECGRLKASKDGRYLVGICQRIVRNLQLTVHSVSDPYSTQYLSTLTVLSGPLVFGKGT
jgi:hypothetical protein